MLFNFLNQLPTEVVTKTWNCVVLVVTQPWFIGIVFGALLVTAILFKVHWILEDKQNSKKTKRRLARRGAPKQSVFSQPWFVAFLCAVVLIIILSVALFYLLVQKQGEEFWGKKITLNNTECVNYKLKKRSV